MSKFHDAAIKGELNEIKRLYESYEIINGKKRYKHTIDETNDSGKTVLTLLVEQKHYEVLQKFIFYINRHGREFLDAAISGDLEKLIVLFRINFRVNSNKLAPFPLEQEDDSQKTVLYHLVENKHHKVLETCAKHLEDNDIPYKKYLRKPDKNGKSPVQVALDNNDIDTLYFLKEQKIEFTREENNQLKIILFENKRNELHEAAKKGDLDRIKILNKMKFELWGNKISLFPMRKQDYEGKTVFHLLVEHGHSRILPLLIKFLKDKRVNLPSLFEITDKQGKNVLHCAAQKKDAGAVFNFLSDHESRVTLKLKTSPLSESKSKLLEKKDKNGASPLDIMFHDNKLNRSILGSYEELTLDVLRNKITQFIKANDYQKILYLYCIGIQLKEFAADLLVDLLLHCLEYKYIEFYPLILQEINKRSNIDVFNHVVDKDRKLIEVLLEDEELFDAFVDNAQHDYFNYNYMGPIEPVFDKDRIFIPYKYDSNNKSQGVINRYYKKVHTNYLNSAKEPVEGNYILHVLAKTNDIALIKYLKENKFLAFILFNNKDETPFEIALHAGNLEAAELLLGKNINAFANYREGETLLHMVAKKGDMLAVRFLKEKGAKLDVQNQAGETPFDLAFELGFEHIAIELLVDPNKNAGIFGRSLAYQANNKGMTVLAEYIKRHDDFDINSFSREKVKSLLLSFIIASLTGLTSAALLAISVGLIEFWPLLLVSGLVAFASSLFITGIRQFPNLTVGLTVLSLSAVTMSLALLVSGGVIPSLMALLSLPISLSWDVYIISGLIGIFAPFALYLGTLGNYRYPSPTGLHEIVFSEGKEMDEDSDNDDLIDIDEDERSEVDELELNTLVTFSNGEERTDGNRVNKHKSNGDKSRLMPELN